jgi:hypothetical protein
MLLKKRSFVVPHVSKVLLIFFSLYSLSCSDLVNCIDPIIGSSSTESIRQIKKNQYIFYNLHLALFSNFYFFAVIFHFTVFLKKI